MWLDLIQLQHVVAVSGWR